MIKVISTAALIAGMASASFAGNLNTVETQPVETVFTPAPSSAGLAVPLAIGGGIVALGLLANDDDDAAPATTTVVAD